VNPTPATGRVISRWSAGTVPVDSPGMTVSATDVDGFPVENEVFAAARARGTRAGAEPVSPTTGSALAFLAATTAARAVVEIGTGSGVSGLWLLSGMSGPSSSSSEGTLTTIDVDPELQRAARRSFLDAGHSPGRVRLINGMALEVLPRLTDGGYDLVLVDVAQGAGRIDPAAADYPGYLAEAIRLLRPGGVVVLHGVLAGQDDPADPATSGLREATRQAAEDERLVPALLPLGGGLLVATRR